MALDRSQSAGLPVDGHVHFHRLGRVEATLDAAAGNFGLVSGAREGLLGALLLVESAREQVFRHLDCQGTWVFSGVPDEPATCIASRGAQQIAVICGRQIRCERGLEVLAYGTRERFPEGEPLCRTLQRVIDAGALASVPWGFGKWAGSRAAVVRELLGSQATNSVFVGDNGGRVRQLPEPKLLRAARQAGFRVLPGSDPFPFGGDEERVGAYGFMVEPVDPAHPWADLRRWLESQKESPPAYGNALGFPRFLFNQVGIQIYNRMYAGAVA